MSERLSDELRAVAALAHTVLSGSEFAALIIAANKLDEFDRLLNGGPCPTCEGKGWVVEVECDPRTYEPLRQIQAHCPNPDCVLGRVPGVIERLEAAFTRTAQGGFYCTDPDALIDAALAVIAALKEAVGE